MADYDIEKAFRAIENELMRSMIRNMKRHRMEEIDEKKEWEMWQALQLKSLEEYKRKNKEKFKKEFSRIDKEISSIISQARAQGSMEQEIKILEAIRKGFKPSRRLTKSTQTMGEFFKLNDRKLDALIRATQNDFQKAEQAMLRMADDQYRKIIFNAQVYANTGAGTYEQAVDMATKDFVSRGINCIEYANGARHTISEYADMAIKTASKRAYLTGEGEMRKEWGISTVILKKRGNACPKCLPFVGKVLIDDVWSGGSQSDGPYLLMSTAVAAGLYHPRCKDIHTTYFEGISTPGASYTKEELKQIEENYRKEQKQQYAKRQEEKFGRLAEFSLDADNRNKYKTKEKEWKDVTESGSIRKEDTEEVIEVYSVGRIDREIYKCVTKDIVTDEVVITENQIKHIKDRHPNDYERFSSYFEEIVKNPDYIIEANRPSTALVLKEIKNNGEVFKTVLRLVTSNDDPKFKNSIITFMKIDEKEWSRLIRNKMILYKKE